ncbi:uncharacterized protein LOC116416948 isoform X2 [Nasonia vitripennis]|uniref:Uncharacterized protein n=1 Tax=Nasonia vitripennis TaxID=7425 RepID=A0A7M7T8Y0_NASVI|nr:uncharacterized protein LOC116416948 isoform X2 [Nasonia vitripennis]
MLKKSRMVMDTSDKIHSLMVPVAKRDRALKDVAYASELLHEHLSALPSSSNARQTNNTETDAMKDGVLNAEKDPVFELTLIEPSTMEKFMLFVDQETFNRAQNDISFAIQLLENHMAALDEQKSNSVSTFLEANNTSNEELQNDTDELKNLIRMYKNDDINDDESSSKQTGRYVWSDAETLLLITLYKDNDAA